MKLNKTYTLAILLLSSFQLQARGNGEFREAMKTCAAETGVTRPERGQRPSDEDRAKIEACLAEKGISKPERPKMDESVKAAFKECAASTGVTRPERGQRPSDEDRAKIDACLSEKGISLPKRS